MTKMNWDKERQGLGSGPNTKHREPVAGLSPKWTKFFKRAYERTGGEGMDYGFLIRLESIVRKTGSMPARYWHDALKIAGLEKAWRNRK